MEQTIVENPQPLNNSATSNLEENAVQDHPKRKPISYVKRKKADLEFLRGSI